MEDISKVWKIGLIFPNYRGDKLSESAIDLFEKTHSQSFIENLQSELVNELSQNVEVTASYFITVKALYDMDLNNFAFPSFIDESKLFAQAFSFDNLNESLTKALEAYPEDQLGEIELKLFKRLLNVCICLVFRFQ